MRCLIIPILALLLSGCATSGPLTTQVVEIKTPVLYSPRPPILNRPNLIIHELSVAERNDPGTVAQYYKASVLQLLGYVEELETVLDQYKVISNTLEDNEKIQEEASSVEIR